MILGFQEALEHLCSWWENKIYWANVGDSRSILARVPNLQEKFNELNEKHLKLQNDNIPSEEAKAGNSNILNYIEFSFEPMLSEIIVIELSHDHKPDLEIERRRIEQNGGEVQPYRDDRGQSIGPPRVWVK